MYRIRKAIENGLGYALFTAAAIGVVAWGTREKCLSGIGLLPNLGFDCPTSVALVAAVAAISFVVFVFSVVRELRKSRSTAPLAKDNDEA